MIERYGKPGGDNFPFLCETHRGKEIMVYAKTMKDAIDEYNKHRTYGPWSVRCMSDNE